MTNNKIARVSKWQICSLTTFDSSLSRSDNFDFI